MKYKRRHKKYRAAGSDGLEECLACRQGDHQHCEDWSLIFCACWRESHDEEIF